jgi:methylaspartate mutase epsilon subunit
LNIKGVSVEIKNERLSDDEFQRMRREVLAEWPTGKEVDLDEAVEFHKSLPPTKNYARRLREAKKNGETLLITGMGHTTLEQHLELITYAQDVGQADLLATSVDSLTRIHDYKGVERGIKESLRTGKSLLNGFPIVNYGVAGTRKLIQSVDVPVQMRFGASDPRLIDEIASAGGHSGNGSEGMLSFWNYTSKLPPETVLGNYQYVHRLYGSYQERGIPMTVECMGLYSAGSIPPSLCIAALLSEVLMAAEQGVKNLLLSFPGQGNLVQDIAAVRVTVQLAREYLDRFGHEDVETYTQFQLCLPKFPIEPNRAFAMIGLHGLEARLCGAQVCVFRTIAEGKIICTKEELADSYLCAKTMINLLKDQKVELDSQAIDIEMKMTELETRAIVAKLLDLGEGDMAVGTIRAIETGVLDNPFSINRHVAGKVMGFRDSEGAVRYADFGNLPFTSDMVEFHREKLAERGKRLGGEVDYETAINDILAIDEGLLIHRPRSEI